MRGPYAQRSPFRTPLNSCEPTGAQSDGPQRADQGTLSRACDHAGQPDQRIDPCRGALASLSGGILLLWVGLICVVVSARFLDRARYLRQPHERRHEVAWARRFTVGAAATGFLWGLCASVVFVSPDPVAHVVVTFVLGGMTVGAVFQQSAYLPAFFSFALPATVPQVVCYLAKGGPSFRLR